MFGNNAVCGLFVSSPPYISVVCRVHQFLLEDDLCSVMLWFCVGGDVKHCSVLTHVVILWLTQFLCMCYCLVMLIVIKVQMKSCRYSIFPPLLTPPFSPFPWK